jgi:hypothetical protein
MNITYYLVGFLTGVSIATFFVGKELYKFYMKYTVQKKQLDRMMKLYDKIKKSETLKTDDTTNVNSANFVNLDNLKV